MKDKDINQYEVVFLNSFGKKIKMKLWLSDSVVALKLRKVKRINK